MTASDPTPFDPTEARVAGDVAGRLDALRERLRSSGSDVYVESLLADVSEAAERICEEHEGMAQELLNVYEQLGIVFEVTRRLPSVQNESEVVDLFIDSLQRSFSDHDVFVVYPPAMEHAADLGTDAAGRHWLAAGIDRARDTASVVVEQVASGALSDLVQEMMVGPVFAGEAFVCAIVFTRGSEAQPFHTGNMLLLESLAMYCGDMVRNHRLVCELREMSMAMVRSLVNAVDQKDEYTSGHSMRVGYYATLLGRAVGLNQTDLQMLRWSALLHDVGKIGIRDEVLKKPGRLTPEEFDHIKEHPVRSHQVVQGVPQLADALDGVLHHHERYDGTGYPEGLAGERIPLQARLIQVADVFDALTSSRAYRPAFDWRQALDILKQEASQTVDPELAGVFDRIIRGALERSPDAWSRMLGRAEQFAGVADLQLCDLEGD